MRQLLIVLLVALATPAQAADSLIAKIGSDWVRLELGPCASPAILKLSQGVPLKAGKARIDGKDFVVCWAQVPGGYAWLFEDGEMGRFPSEYFVPETGV